MIKIIKKFCASFGKASFTARYPGVPIILRSHVIRGLNRLTLWLPVSWNTWIGSTLWPRIKKNSTMPLKIIKIRPVIPKRLPHRIVTFPSKRFSLWLSIDKRQRSKKTVQSIPRPQPTRLKNKDITPKNKDICFFDAPTVRITAISRRYFRRYSWKLLTINIPLINTTTPESICIIAWKILNNFFTVSSSFTVNTEKFSDIFSKRLLSPEVSSSGHCKSI